MRRHATTRTEQDAPPVSKLTVGLIRVQIEVLRLMAVAIARTRLSTTPKRGRQKAEVISVAFFMIFLVHPSSAMICSLDSFGGSMCAPRADAGS